jgi:3',5'-cyclic AMP phosphodiesterase CpdA
MAEDGEVVFAWLHLSDVHFGHGDEAHRWSQEQVVNSLIDDIRTCIERRPDPAPRPQALFLTGDVAFKGAANEYHAAAEWLRKLTRVVGLTRRDVYVVPGNHDVQRTSDRERQAWRLLQSLRSVPSSITEALQDPQDRALLTERFGNYLRFAKQFSPASRAAQSGAEQWLFWRHLLTPVADLSVRLIGLNTALLCNDDHDEGRLGLGTWQADMAGRVPNEIVIVLAHHPFTWLGDYASPHVRAIEASADLVLSGHIHVPERRKTTLGSGAERIDLVAGAVHGEKDSREQGYRITAIVRRGDGFEIRDWPRRWSLSRQRYERDSDNLPPDTQEPYGCAELKRLRPAKVDAAHFTPEPLNPLGRLTGYPHDDDALRDWIIDPRDAREWLEALGLRREELIVGHVTADSGRPLRPPREDAGPTMADAVECIREAARNQCPTGIASVLLHGLRGLGKTVLVLRYVASAGSRGIRIMVDCGTHAGHNLAEAYRDLEQQLLSAADNDEEIFVAVDGLDLACRARAVQDGKQAQTYLAPEIEHFRRTIHRAVPGRSVVLLFTVDDYPDPKQTGASRPGWATECAKRIIEDEWSGLSCTLDAAYERRDRDTIAGILPRPWNADATVASFMMVPVFFDAVRGLSPTEVLALRTKREVLAQGARHAERLGARRHGYYKTLPELNAFVAALRAANGKAESQDACIERLKFEITGEWRYLFEINEDEVDVVDRLSKLHNRLKGNDWRHASHFALSNIATLLDVLHAFSVQNETYQHCNLRNVQLLNKPTIRGAEFLGVDFTGAHIEDGVVSDAKFFGNDFSGARFDKTTLDGASRFVGCRFSHDTFSTATLGRSVEIVEPIAPDGWRPPERIDA